MGIIDLSNNNPTVSSPAAVPAPPPSNQPTPTVPPQPHKFRTQQELKTSTIFDNELAVTKIKHQVDGMRWTIDYFNQILNINTQPMSPDINIPSTTLKYNRIDHLDMYVNSGLPTGVATDINGTGIINAGFVPIVGDAFTATIAGGRLAIFVLTAVTKEYYNTHDIYSVDYKLTYFLDTSAAIYNDLVYKTIRTYAYDREAVTTDTPPILLLADYKVKLDLARQPAKILGHYLDTFYDNRHRLLTLPTTMSSYVDQLAMRAVFRLSSVNDDYRLNKLVRPDTVVTAKTIWDAVIDRDPNLLVTCVNKLQYAMTTHSSLEPVVAGSYLGINYTITDRVSGTVAVPEVLPNPLAVRKAVPDPITPPVDTYIFSNDVYANNYSGALTDFELLLLDYVNGKTPRLDLLTTQLNSYMHWGYERQYQLLPILMVITKAAVSSTYSAI